jgi:translation initiation factor IF-2
VGAITESDIGLAEASGAPVFGFNVRANAPARQSANQKGVEIRYYSVIYDLVDDVKAAASGLLGAKSARTSSAMRRSRRSSRSPVVWARSQGAS